MEIVKLNEQDYENAFPDPYHQFNSVKFNANNALTKEVALEFLAFKTKKYKIGLIGLVEGNWFKSPFSAPFGGFSYGKSDSSLETIDKCIEVLLSHLQKEKITGINLGMPPLFYDNSFISKVNNSLYRQGFEILKNDLNYSLDLESLRYDYIGKIQYNARKNLNIALEKDFQLHLCRTLEEKQLAYNIIQQNRESKGYPLRMGFEDVLRTINVINADFFLLKLGNDWVASAMIFHVAKGIVQVVYWGDLLSFNSNKTMNYLSYSIVNFYLETDIKVIDIGPSTENSIPNYGLCDFKESIGCTIYPKYNWSIKL